MYNFLKQVSRNKNFQDAAGVVRGLAKVNTQILLRSNHASSDLQRFGKNVGKDLEKLGQSLDDASDFINTATETFSVPDTLGEFVTFEKPEFDFEAEQKLYDQQQREQILGDQNKLEGQGEGNRAATFENLDSFSQEDMERIADLIEPEYNEPEMQVTNIDLGKQESNNLIECSNLFRRICKFQRSQIRKCC